MTRARESAPRIGVVGVRGGWSTGRLCEAVARATGREPLLVEMDRVGLDLPSGRAFFEGQDLGTLDALVVKKLGAGYAPELLDRLEILRLLEARGLAVFSRPRAMGRLINRLSCTVTLQAEGVPMPPTTLAPGVPEALQALETYGRAVFKPLYGSKARGMVLLERGPGAAEAVAAFARDNPLLYVQKAIDFGGLDLGVVFLGGEYLTTYARRGAPGAWNTTTASGGRYEPFDPPPEALDAARKAQDCFGLDFTCVDVALTPDGPLVFEVSAFGGFRGVLRARGLDPAPLLVRHVLDRLQERGRGGRG